MTFGVGYARPCIYAKQYRETSALFIIKNIYKYTSLALIYIIYFNWQMVLLLLFPNKLYDWNNKTNIGNLFRHRMIQYGGQSKRYLPLCYIFVILYECLLILSSMTDCCCVAVAINHVYSLMSSITTGRIGSAAVSSQKCQQKPANVVLQ